MFIKEEKRNWGKGIPSYKEEDLMSKEYLYDFALDIVYNFGKKNGLIAVDANRNMNTYPSLVFKKDNQLLFVLVEAGIMGNHPEINAFRKVNMLNHAKKFGAIPLYAAVSFGSTDEERKARGIALKGDEYYAQFFGLELIKSDLKEVDTLEYEFTMLSIIGNCCQTKDFSPMDTNVTSDYNIYLENPDKSKIILNHVIKEYLEMYKNKEVFTSICYYEDESYNIIPLLFIGYEDEEGRNNIQLKVTINDNGDVNQMKLYHVDYDKLVF